MVLMVSPVQRLRHWLADESHLYECRDCGTTLEASRDTCPVCGSDDVVSYEIE